MPTKDMFNIVTGKGGDTVKVSDARWFVLATNVVNAAVSSIIARNRQNEGKLPIAKVFW